jgi:HPt (histidine-containing phosphotransfer) domain-containing protein
MRGFEKECLDAGYSDYFTKPIDIDRLVERLAEILKAVPAESSQRKPLAPAKLHKTLEPAQSEFPLESTLKAKDSHFAAIADRFAARLGGQLDTMAEAWRNRDYASLAALAHWLKGAGGTVGFDVLTSPALNLEDAAREHNDMAIHHALKAIHDLAIRIPGVIISAPLSGNLSPASTSPTAEEAAPSTPVVSRLAANPRMQRLIDKFLARLSDEEQKMCAAWEEGDLRQLADSARWLKGAGGTLGFDMFTEPAKNLEACANNGEHETVPSLLATISDLHERIRTSEQQTSSTPAAPARSMEAG